MQGLADRLSETVYVQIHYAQKLRQRGYSHRFQDFVERQLALTVRRRVVRRFFQGLEDSDRVDVRTDWTEEAALASEDRSLLH